MSTQTPAARRLRDHLAGQGEQSLAAAARRRRWSIFLERFPDLATARVLDLGGTPAFWMNASVRPAHLSVLNLSPATGVVPEWIEVLVGDACRAPEAIGSRQYDIVFSNSTIEHVGGHSQCLAFADSVRRVAPRHWIQTPYRYFPVEPHFVFPGLQFLPLALRSRAISHWPLSYTRSGGGSISDPVDVALSVNLLSRTEMRHYFPTSDLIPERFLGLTKSLIAVKS